MESHTFIANNKGYTVMELMVTMLIMTMVTLMIYEAMTDQHRSFFNIMKRSENIHASVQLKSKIDRAIATVDTILSVNRMTLEYRDTAATRHNLSIRNGILYFDSDSIAGGVKSAHFKVEEGDCGVKTLLWEITFDNEYFIGGGRNFY